MIRWDNDGEWDMSRLVHGDVRSVIIAAPVNVLRCWFFVQMKREWAAGIGNHEDFDD
jgi:hypothetical protein